MGEHVNELTKLLPDSKEHISNVVLPIGNRVRHASILLNDLLSHCLDAVELLQGRLIALVYVMNILFANETLDTSIGLLLFLPEVEGHAMILAQNSRLMVCTLR